MKPICLIATGLALVNMFLIVNCGTVPRPSELVKADQQMQNRMAAQNAASAAPQVFKLSQKYYKLAEEAYEDGELENCIFYATMAGIKFATAMEHTKRLSAEDRRAKAEQRTESAKKTKAEQDARLADLEKRISRMEQIIALKSKLESEQQKSAKEKKLIATQLEKAKSEAKTKLEAEQKAAAERLATEKARATELEQEKGIQELIALASSKIQTADALEASNYDPSNINSAKTFVQQAQAALSGKRYDNARDLAKMADAKAGLAIEKAKTEYARKKEEAGLLKERENLFNDANAVGVEVKQEKRGVVLTIYEMFAPRKTIVLPEQAYLLDKIASLAEKYPEYPIVIEGFTDSQGRDENNLALSQGRAQSVLDYLIQQKKLKFDRVKSSGYGEANPVADNSSAEGRAKNRRVEVIFLFR